MRESNNSRTIPELTKPIALCGMTGAGKTSVGRKLAELTGFPFLDLDQEIEKQCGRSISEIFKTSGEPEFRATERKVLSELWQADPKIIALGGGALQSSEFADRVAHHTMLVYLDIPVSDLVERLQDKTDRPLLRNADGSLKTPDELASQLEKMKYSRETLYRKARLHLFVSNQKPAAQIAETILEKLNTHE